MEKIIFEDLPRTNTPVDAYNLNKLQDNIEESQKVNMLTNQSFPTNEYLDGKRIYGYIMKFNVDFIANTQVTFDLPFADEIERAWIDLSNSHLSNELMTETYNTRPLNGRPGNFFEAAIITKNKLSIVPDSDWSANWTFRVAIKYTKKD